MGVGKYKVGDKVLIRDDLVVYKEYDGVCFVDSMNDYRGKIMTISKVDTFFTSYIYKMKEDKSCWTFSNGMIVGKAGEKMDTFTKDDLKTGMIATDRKGREWLVLCNCECKDEKKDIMIYNDGWTHLRDYNDDLTACFDKGYDIVKIELSNVYSIESVFTGAKDSHRKLIWERDSKLKQAKQLLSEYYNKPIENIVVVVQ